MVNLTKSTTSIKASEIERKWHLIDAKEQVVGRIATQIANLLMGKGKSNYVSYLDMGDNVVVINILRVEMTGTKKENKLYSNFSGYPGGLKKTPFNELMKHNPIEIMRHAVSGMLPKNKHRDPRLARLFIYSGDKHPYTEKFEIKNTK